MWLIIVSNKRKKTERVGKISPEHKGRFLFNIRYEESMPKLIGGIVRRQGSWGR